MNESEKDKRGLVYIITNPKMPNLVKIGYTKNLKKRLDDLDTTGIPAPFEPYFTVTTSKYMVLEKVIHRELDKLTDSRVRSNREYFEIDPELAKDLLSNISRLLDDAETEDYGNSSAGDVIDDDGSIRPISGRTTFKMLSIPVGTALEPLNDSYPPVTTADDVNQVRLPNGDVKAISRVAVDVYGTKRNGFMCYRLNGVLLSDMRKKIDKNYLPSHQK